MTTGRIAFLLGCWLALLSFVAGALAPRPADASPRGFAAELLEAHNGERQRYGLAPLSWSNRLAGEAQEWANQIARTEDYKHSTKEGRRGAGENLWAGPRGQKSGTDMIEAFLDERRYFRAGTFPNVSTTGKWNDVGHYTQIIWPHTTEVGCAVAPGQQWDYLVCRYWPAGNTIGRPVGQRQR